MKLRTALLFATAGLACAGALAWAFAPRPIAVEVVRVVSGPYEQAIVEDGRTRLRERHVLTAPMSGRIDRIELREGDAVRAGAVLAVMRPLLPPLPDARSQLGLSARAETAEAAVQRAVAGEDRAQVALERARADRARTEQLAQKGFVSPSRLEIDRSAELAARADLAAAQEARHVAEHERQTARAALVSTPVPRDTWPPLPLRAPITGTVLRIVQTSEATVSQGTPLIELGDLTQIEIVAELLTTDALQVRPGARVHLDRWGGPGELEARVRLVEPGAFTRLSALGVEEQRVKVLMDLVNPADHARALGDAYRVGVRVVTVSEASVRLVPVSAVFARAEGGMAVFVLDGSHARLRRVEVGGRNGVHAWIREGLREGETVLVYPPAELRDGERVRVRVVAAD